jgi:hypothetical protein
LKIEQSRWTTKESWVPDFGPRSLVSAKLVLAFGARNHLAGRYSELRAAYPCARILGCSTAGEILGTAVTDGQVVATAIDFKSATVRSAHAPVQRVEESRAVGETLARELFGVDLIHVFVLSDGLAVNGSELARGLYEAMPAGVGITGGLAADGPDFKTTLTLLDAEAEPGSVCAIGIYGSGIRIGYGSVGGWDPFGVEWRITRSRGNVLFELDDKPALDLYKTYLGDHAAGLPVTGLFFPLSLRSPQLSRPVVRTILAVNEDEGSLTFAGDMPEGTYVRFMKANFERLIEGACHAARDSVHVMGGSEPELAILVSCVGRKLVLKQRIEEEVEAVREIIGPNAVIAGYYSYGELAPFMPLAPCELHNQTMTITVLSEE